MAQIKTTPAHTDAFAAAANISAPKIVPFSICNVFNVYVIYLINYITAASIVI